MKRPEIIEEYSIEAATVPPELGGLRLDAAAARLFDRHSRSQLQRWIGEGHLRVNSRVTNVARQRLRAGDELRLRVPAPRDTLLAAQRLELDVVHEDAALVVLNKPAGLTVHPGAGRPDRTLQNALLHRWPQTRALPRSGLVHRLDKDTSGLLVVALTARAHQRLVEAMQERRIKREYDAVVAGVLPAGGTVRAPIARHPRDRVKMAVVMRGRPAVTHYRVLERFAQHTHLRVRLETGRTHQIRVHLAHIRHPVLGDPVYGGRIVRGSGLPEDLRRRVVNFPRQALHARELGLEHPATGAHLTFVREPPADLQELLAALRAHGRGGVKPGIGMDLLRPGWDAPAVVRAAMTTRALDAAAEDDRRRLRAELELPAEPGWLRQVHGTRVVRLPAAAMPEADASYTTEPGVVCAVQAADCLPVLLCDDAGTVVAAAHAGWRGLVAGVLEATVQALPARPAALQAWLGAAIGPESFEVGAEVRAAFVAADPAAAAAFRPGPASGKHFADLFRLARQRLVRAGVTRVSGGGIDTFRDPGRFFSYRRDGRCGRMAALIWLASEA